jgi:hypothetical protein
MTRPTNSPLAQESQVIDKHHKRALALMLEKGVAAIGLGAASLVVPAFLEPSPNANAIASAFRMGGWIAVGVGLVLLIVRFSVQSKARKRANLPRRDAARVDSHHASQESARFGAKAAAAQALAMQSRAAAAPESTGK